MGKRTEKKIQKKQTGYYFVQEDGWTCSHPARLLLAACVETPRNLAAGRVGFAHTRPKARCLRFSFSKFLLSNWSASISMMPLMFICILPRRFRSLASQRMSSALPSSAKISRSLHYQLDSHWIWFQKLSPLTLGDPASSLLILHGVAPSHLIGTRVRRDCPGWGFGPWSFKKRRGKAQSPHFLRLWMGPEEMENSLKNLFLGHFWPFLLFSILFLSFRPIPALRLFSIPYRPDMIPNKSARTVENWRKSAKTIGVPLPIAFLTIPWCRSGPESLSDNRLERRATISSLGAFCMPCVARKRAEYCFESTVSEERTR